MGTDLFSGSVRSFRKNQQPVNFTRFCCFTRNLAPLSSFPLIRNPSCTQFSSPPKPSAKRGCIFPFGKGLPHAGGGINTPLPPITRDDIPLKEANRTREATGCRRPSHTSSKAASACPDLPPLPTRQATLIGLGRRAAPIHDRRRSSRPSLSARSWRFALRDYPRAVWHARRSPGPAAPAGTARSGMRASPGQGTEGLLRRLFPASAAVPGIAFPPAGPPASRSGVPWRKPWRASRPRAFPQLRAANEYRTKYYINRVAFSDNSREPSVA